MERPPPRSTLFPYTTLFRSLLDDRRLAGVDELDLGALRIDADHFMTVFRKASRGYGADVSKPQHANFHLARMRDLDRKSTRLNSSHGYISYAVFCLKKKNSL